MQNKLPDTKDPQFAPASWLESLVGRALWEGPDKPPVPWKKLKPHEQAEWVGMAKVALKVVLNEVVMPEYERWRETDEIGAIGACANIAAKLSGVGGKLSNAASERQPTEDVP